MSASKAVPPEEEAGILDKAEAKLAIAVAKRLAQYAVRNLQFLVYDKDGNILLPEVHEYLRAHITNIEELTNDDIAEALEKAGDRYFSYDYIDVLLSGIENRWLRGGIESAVRYGRKRLHKNQNFVQELQEKKNTILLTFLSTDSTTAEEYRLLKDRPKLRKFITEAFFVKMGIPIERVAAAPPRPPPPGVQ